MGSLGFEPRSAGLAPCKSSVRVDFVAPQSLEPAILARLYYDPSSSKGLEDAL